MEIQKKEYKKFKKTYYKKYFLAGDVGGTNTNLGLFGVKGKKLDILISRHYKSQELTGLNEAVNEIMGHVKDSYGISIKDACLAPAGVLSSKKDFVKITNVGWDVSKKRLLRGTGLKNIIFINDFMAIGYGTNIIRKNDLKVIKKAKEVNFAPKVVVGAGTGLGKSTLIYNRNLRYYDPIQSEAGHIDFAAQSKEDLALVDFIKKTKKIRQNVPFELILSGKGFVTVYNFLRASKKFHTTKYTKEVQSAVHKPQLISKYRKVDPACKATLKLMKKYYARFAMSFAVDSLCYGGLYIAGGIAPKNIDMFDKVFVKIFEDNLMMKHVLKKIPIYLVLSYDLGLRGAGFAGLKLLYD
jgi:glucokinase